MTHDEWVQECAVYEQRIAELQAEVRRLQFCRTKEHEAFLIVRAERDAARARFADMEAKRNALFEEACAARAEVARLREAESDEAWMRRVYPQHGYSPDDGITYAQFCRLSRGKWEAEHTELRKELAQLREWKDAACKTMQDYVRNAERHTAAVEAAFTEAYQLGSDDNNEGCYLRVERWLASEAKARLA